MWHPGKWFSGGLGRAGLTVGLNDLKGLLQSKLFCDSVIQISLGFNFPSLANFIARSPLLRGSHDRVSGTLQSYGKTTVTGTSISGGAANTGLWISAVLPNQCE